MLTNFFTTAGATFQIGPCKLEVGSTATPMLRQSFQQELARCQRYYEKSYNPGIAPGSSTGSNGFGQTMFAGGQPNSSNTLAATAVYKVTKRAVPTVTYYSFSGSVNIMSCYVSGAWTGNAGALQNTTQNGHGAAVAVAGLAYIAWDYVADARL